MQIAGLADLGGLVADSAFLGVEKCIQLIRCNIKFIGGIEQKIQPGDHIQDRRRPDLHPAPLDGQLAHPGNPVT